MRSLFASNRTVRENTTEKEFLTFLAQEANFYMKEDEWYLALDTVLDGLYEIDYKLDAYHMDATQKAIEWFAVSQPELLQQYHWLPKLKK